MEPDSLNTTIVELITQDRPIRVLSVISGKAVEPSMISAKRLTTALKKAGIPDKTFYLASRTSLIVLASELIRFRKEIKSFRPDLVHAHYGTMTAFFCAIATRLPLVVTYRGSDLNPNYSISWARSALGRLLSQVTALRASQVICVSQQLEKRLWWGHNRTSVIPGGVNTAYFYPRPRDQARAELGWGKGERVVLFNAGGRPKSKRLDLARSAIDVAETICGRIRFVVLDGRVKQAVIATLMSGADCLLVTSDFEGSPGIVKEAIACNLPVVSVNVGDVRERLAGVRPSQIVSREPGEIGKVLAEVIMKGERSNGYEAIQDLTQKKTAARVLSVYERALMKNPV